MRANQILINAVLAGGITPEQCPRCWQAEGNWSAGQDDGRDADYVGYQCGSCGHVEGLTRGEVEQTIADQLDTYRTAYNTQRPHQGIAMSTPAARHQTGQRPLPPATGVPDQHRTPTACTDHLVNARGQIRLAATSIGLGSQWAGCKVTTFRTGDHVLVLHRDELVRELTIDHNRSFQPTGQPRGGPRRTRHLDTIT